MNLNNWGNKPAKSYELIITVKVEERQNIIQLGILSLCSGNDYPGKSLCQKKL